MLLTLFLAIIVCAAVTLMLISAVAFIQDKRLFSSAPKEALALIQPKQNELFSGAHVMGWVLLIFSAVMILGALAVAIWDGFRSGYTLAQFFTEDFAEMLSMYICNTPEQWDAWLEQADADAKEKGDDAPGSTAIKSKLSIVRQYMAESWDIDIDHLRATILEREDKVVSGKLDLTDLSIN